MRLRWGFSQGFCHLLHYHLFLLSEDSLRDLRLFPIFGWATQDLGRNVIHKLSKCLLRLGLDLFRGKLSKTALEPNSLLILSVNIISEFRGGVVVPEHSSNFDVFLNLRDQVLLLLQDILGCVVEDIHGPHLFQDSVCCLCSLILFLDVYEADVRVAGLFESSVKEPVNKAKEHLALSNEVSFAVHFQDDPCVAGRTHSHSNNPLLSGFIQVLFCHTHPLLLQPLDGILVGIVCLLQSCFALSQRGTGLLSDSLEEFIIDFEAEELFVEQPLNH